MDCDTPGFLLLHRLPEFAQTHVYWVSDAVHPSHPRSSPSPLALNLSQHQGPFQWVSSSHQVVKVQELQLQHPSFQWKSGLISFRMDSFALSAFQGTEASPASRLEFMFVCFLLSLCVLHPVMVLALLLWTKGIWHSHLAQERFSNCCSEAGRQKVESWRSSEQERLKGFWWLEVTLTMRHFTRVRYLHRRRWAWWERYHMPHRGNSMKKWVLP